MTCWSASFQEKNDKLYNNLYYQSRLILIFSDGFTTTQFGLNIKYVYDWS